MATFIIFLNTANNGVTQTWDQKALDHYIKSLFFLTTPGQAHISRDLDTPLSWVRHMEGLKCQVDLNARTHGPEWALGMWAAAPQPLHLFLPGRWRSALLLLWCVCNSIGKVNVVRFSVRL